MNEVQPSTHPVALISTIANLYGWDLTLSFSRYFYRPQSVMDERVQFQVPILDVTSDWLAAEISDLKEGWELAMNSIIMDRRGRTRHLGMIDMVGRPQLPLVKEKIEHLLGPKAMKRGFYYDSGRSLHVYILELIGVRAWHDFLGRLLLMNAPNEESIVDARWIGHRLIGGYSALRWSANTSNYKSMPIAISE